MTDINANLNNTDCLVQMTNFGEQVVHNICTGTVNHIPWGTMDYIGIGILCLLGLAFVVMILAMIYTMIKGALEW